MSEKNSKIPTSPMIRSNKTYDTLKYIAQIVLPAIATLYFALSEIWGLPFGPEIVGTITALDTFLGVLLKLSTKAYARSDLRFDGTIDVWEDESSKQFMLNLDDDPYHLGKKNEVVFKINHLDEDSFS